MEIMDILHWISENVFCHGVIVIFIVAIVFESLVQIIFAITNYSPKEIKKEDEK